MRERSLEGRPHVDVIASLLTYEPETGFLFWKHRPGARQSINSRLAGKRALTCVSAHGYLRGLILGRGYLAHTICWVLNFGEWPDREIDHINRDRSDNRIANLRLATRSQNAMNTPPYKNNKSSMKGVFFHKSSGRWKAAICVDKNKITLGFFDNPKSAHDAYVDASRRLHGEFGRTKA